MNPSAHQRGFQIRRPLISPSLLKNPSNTHNSSLPVFPGKRHSLSEARRLGFPVPIHSVSPLRSSRILLSRCAPEKSSDSFEQDLSQNAVPEPNQVLKEKEDSFVKILKEANSILPQVVLASTVLAILYPPSFTWFTNSDYLLRKL